MKNYCLLLSFLLLITAGCYTEKKAAKQTEKALEAFPDVAAELIRKEFPCVTTSVDSSKYLNSIANLNILLQDSRRKEAEKADRLQVIKDSLNNVFSGNDSSYTCEDERDDLLNYSSRLLIEKEALERRVNKQDKAIANLEILIRGIQPIEVKVEDSAKIRLLQKAADAERIAREKAEAERDQWKEKYTKLGAWDIKGWNWLIPWYVFVIIGISIWLSAKFKWLNIGKKLSGKT